MPSGRRRHALGTEKKDFKTSHYVRCEHVKPSGRTARRLALRHGEGDMSRSSNVCIWRPDRWRWSAVPSGAQPRIARRCRGSKRMELEMLKIREIRSESGIIPRLAVRVVDDRARHDLCILAHLDQALAEHCQRNCHRLRLRSTALVPGCSRRNRLEARPGASDSRS